MDPFVVYNDKEKHNQMAQKRKETRQNGTMTLKKQVIVPDWPICKKNLNWKQSSVVLLVTVCSIQLNVVEVH